MMKKRKFLPIAAIAAVALVAAACGGGGDDGAMGTGGMDTPPPPATDTTGLQAFTNLSGALLEAASLDALRSDQYDDIDEEDVDTTDVDESADNGGGVTSSLTTHEEPATIGEAETTTGVSDIFVAVTAAEKIPEDAMTTVTVQKLDDTPGTDENTEPPDTDTLRDDHMIENPVLVDDNGMVTSDRGATFTARSDWDRNPADEWVSDMLMSETQMMDGFWTYMFDSSVEGMDLEGGRTLHLDLRSDFDANMTSMGDAIDIARGPGSTDGDPMAVRVEWDDVIIDDIDRPGHGNEIDLGTGMTGSYMGVRGTFSCVESSTGDEQQICRVNHHTLDMLTPSEDDLLRFTPDVYTADMDWLAAGVWLTIPDDEEEGDYAIGAFVFGSDPYKPTASDAGAITGTASYEGEAFGRYAESEGDDTEVGRFTADAELTADFGDSTAMGTIQGELSGFMANGQAEGWDVHFEQAMLMLGMDMSVPPQPVDETALRFNAGASGHSRGHGMTGYWNGQFYGSAADGASDDDLQPGSAAGTFGLTTERDNEDNYSLTMGGAFAAHR